MCTLIVENAIMTKARTTMEEKMRENEIRQQRNTTGW